MTQAEIAALVKSIEGNVAKIGADLGKRLDAIEVAGTGASEKVAAIEAAQKEMKEAIEGVRQLIPARGGIRDAFMGGIDRAGKSREQLNAQMRFIASNDPHKNYDADEAKALLISHGPSGGFAVPVEFDTEVHELAYRIGVFWPNATIVNNAPIQGRGLIEDGDWEWGDAGEDTAPPETSFTDLLKQYTWNLKEKGALATISNHLLKEAAFDVASFLSRKAARSIAPQQDTWAFNGNGSNQMAGVRIAQGVQTDTAESTYTYDDLIDLEMAMEEPYLADAAIYMTKKALKIIAKLKDENGLPILLNPHNASMQGLSVDWKNFKGFLNITQPYPYFLMRGGLDGAAKTMIPENLGVGENATEIWMGPRMDYQIESSGVMEASQDSTGENWQKNRTQLKFLVSYDGRVMTPRGWVKQSNVIA